MSRVQFALTFKSAETIAPGVKHLVFTYPGEFQFIPGQFITLHIPHEEKMLNRSYSLANKKMQTNTVEFAASYVANGRASELLFNLKEGDQINATGPFGRLILREENPKRYFLIATGTGVTPYRAMLPQIAERLKAQTELEIFLLFGVRTPEDLLYRNEFAEFAQQNPRFKFCACYSRDFSTEPQGYEYSGYVHQILMEFSPHAESDVVYLCGNPNMVDETYAKLHALNFSTQNVRREKYISSN